MRLFRYSRCCSGFTLVELLCVIGIIAVLTAALTPVIITAHRRGQSATCLSNVRQQSVALQAYTQDYDGNYPQAITVTFVHNEAKGGKGWYTAIYPYAGKHYFLCPARWASSGFANNIAASGYAINLYLNDEQTDADKTSYQGIHESAVQLPSNTVTVLDVRAGIIGVEEPDLPNAYEVKGIFDSKHEAEILKQTAGALRHNGGANYAFADGHAKWLRPTALTRSCKSGKPCFLP